MANKNIPKGGLPPRSEAQLDIPRAHIKSFNYFLEEGLSKAVQDLQPVEVDIPDLGYVRFWFDSVKISTPCKTTYDDKLFPSECRQLGTTYSAPCFGVVSFEVKGGAVQMDQRLLGRIPVMVKSAKCHLTDLTPEQLVSVGEEPNEMGGYFIINGLEKLTRLLIVPRGNNPMAIKQPKNVARGKSYSPFGIEIRSVRPDQTTLRNVIHYLTDGNCTLRFSLFKREYFVPVIVLLKAFIDTTDREIYEKLTQGDETNTFVTDRVELLLREAKQYGVTTKNQSLAFLGSRFRNALRAPARLSDKYIGTELIKRFILVHLPSDQAKFNYLIFLVKKLYSFVAGDIRADNSDCQMNQEILLPGHVYLMFIKEKLQEWLGLIAFQYNKDIRRGATNVEYLSFDYFRKCMDRCMDIGQRIEYFLSTGNLVSSTGLDLLQKSGFSVIAEKLNYLRYLSHFRSVHRGQFFTTMKTTKVRKLLPEGWGFLCPVHTPDGAPCGLLNHLTMKCHIVTEEEPSDTLPTLLASLGMKPVGSSIVFPVEYLAVMLNGEIVGYLPPDLSKSLVSQLRFFKVERLKGVPQHLEIVLTGPETRQYPGIFLFSTLGRMSRPVMNVTLNKVEWIGSMEQVFLEIACTPDDFDPKFTTHVELDSMNMLSIIASLTPFSDFNQSPRNMYQCQMGKQTMATPCTAYQGRIDNKMYRIQNPQRPLVRNKNQDVYRIDDFPQGANACVAVISYTGFDMEDAMIINKSAYERGFGHASVYKTETVDLRERGCIGTEIFSNSYIQNQNGEETLYAPTLDADGLPFVGQLLTFGDPYMCIKDTISDRLTIKTFKGKEDAFIDQITLLGATANAQKTKVNIRLRMNRNPLIGDKFSSRHGQKGVLSKLWPHTDMPFTESGMTPDVIINPHAFPSRMTIGMLIESMAGKSGALHGAFIDSTPFQFDEKNTAIDHFGEQLVKAGYNYHGNESMYSGISGTPMKADIFYGVVYYQRLRHMVSDKFQVRSTGPNNNITRQPVKGRKVGGGIRLGEMERDSLLAHGAAFMLHDRLLNCSDTHKGYICGLCGGILPPLTTANHSGSREVLVTCMYCDTNEGIRLLNIPFVFRYLANELAAMNIRLALNLTDAASV